MAGVTRAAQEACHCCWGPLTHAVSVWRAPRTGSREGGVGGAAAYGAL